MYIKNLPTRLLVTFAAVGCICTIGTQASEEKDKPTRIPTSCEVCRVLANEMEDKMKSSYSKMSLELGSRASAPGSRKVDYSRSELRLMEVLEGACVKVSDYYVHAKEGMQRYAKQESDTLDALNDLRKRGVKVDIGIPWSVVDNQPNKEISALKRKCEALIEDHEEDLSEWYFHHQEKPLVDYFCRDNILKNENQTCLSESWLPYGDRDDTPKPKKPKVKEPEEKLKDEL